MKQSFRQVLYDYRGGSLVSSALTTPAATPASTPVHPLPALQELAHLYHYYLHGEQGNRAAGGSAAVREGRLPNGEPFPDIVLRYQVQELLGASVLAQGQCRESLCAARSGHQELPC